MALGQEDDVMGQDVVPQEIPSASPALQPMSPAVAFKNIVAVVRSFSGNADAHDLLQQSLVVIRERLIRADEADRN